jgi:hypothetical protein
LWRPCARRAKSRPSARAQAGGRRIHGFATTLEVLAPVMNMNNVFSSGDIPQRLFREWSDDRPSTKGQGVGEQGL